MIDALLRRGVRGRSTPAVGMMVVGLVLAAVTAGCSSTPSGAAGETPSGDAVPVAATVQPPALVSISPAEGSKGVRPDRQVQVSVVRGTLDTVQVVDAAGATVPGEIDSQSGQWRATGPLAVGKTYTVTAKATGEDGKTTAQTSTFTTLTPKKTASAVLIPGDDWVVGVAMPVVVAFSQNVTDRAAAEAALQVTSKPQVEGAWRWFSDREVHWRPKEYWPSGTTVDVTAKLAGAELAPGVWGKRTVTSHFTVGKNQILTVDVAAHKLSMTRDGALVKSIPVTTGKAGFRTRGGTKVIMDKQEWVNMDAGTLGTDKNSPDYYNLKVQYAMRLTWSGEYLHAAPWSVGSQGRANVSHGCTGMSNANARWLFNAAQIGDPVVYRNSSRPLEPGNGYTDWDMSFEQYAA